MKSFLEQAFKMVVNKISDKTIRKKSSDTNKKN